MKFTYSSEDIKEMAEELGLEEKIAQRVSKLLIVELWIRFKFFNFDPFPVIAVINYLEGVGRSPGTKQCSPFTRNPMLKNLWHAHYSSVRSIPRNILGHPIKEGFKRKVEEFFQGYEDDKSLSPEDLNLFTNFITNYTFKNYLEKLNSKKLTGEWIIFAKHAGENYYLCLGTHEEGKGKAVGICSKIKRCESEFSFLTDLIGA